tara:strand:+ start:34177 stop:35127 length:951 start_codon:yes stop_codon:yes gene_type:complete
MENNNSRKFSIKLGFSLIVMFVLMLANAKLGWAQSARDAFRVEKFAANSGVEIDVKTSGGSIKVIGKDTDEVTVEMYVRKRGKYIKGNDKDLKGWEIDLSKNGNSVTAHARRENGFSWNRNSVSIGFVIYAPRESATNIKTSGGSIKIENLVGDQQGNTSGGSVSADNIKGKLDLKTSGGSIKIAEVTGDVKASTSGGRIEAKNVEGNVDLKSSGGSIGIESVGGSVTARTSGGSISAKIEAPEDYIDLKTSGGSITITVPQDKGYDVDLDGSRVDASFENFKGRVERDEMTGTLNGGGITLKAKTSGGSIRLRYF